MLTGERGRFLAARRPCRRRHPNIENENRRGSRSTVRAQGMRACSARNCLHVNAPAPLLLRYEPTIDSHISEVPSVEAMRGGIEVVAQSSVDETDGALPHDSS